MKFNFSELKYVIIKLLRVIFSPSRLHNEIHFSVVLFLRIPNKYKGQKVSENCMKGVGCTCRRGTDQLYFSLQISSSEFWLCISTFKYLCRNTDDSQEDIVLKGLIWLLCEVHRNCPWTSAKIEPDYKYGLVLVFPFEILIWMKYIKNNSMLLIRVIWIIMCTRNHYVHYPFISTLVLALL